jgi:hypothetical protein
VRNDQLAREIVNLRSVILAISGVVVGVTLLYISGEPELPVSREPLRTLTQQLGGAIFVAAALTILWDLFARRAFLAEVLSLVNLRDDIMRENIVKVSRHINGSKSTLDWDDYLRRTRNLDICVPYANTWRRNQIQPLQDLIRTRGAKIRLIIPDEECEDAVRDLARQKREPVEKVKGYIQDIRLGFEALGHNGDPDHACIEIYVLDIVPRFSMYIFDEEAVLAIPSHRGVNDVEFPVFVGKRSGPLSMYATLRDEFQGILGFARRVYPRTGAPVMHASYDPSANPSVGSLA